MRKLLIDFISHLLLLNCIKITNPSRAILHFREHSVLYFLVDVPSKILSFQKFATDLILITHFRQFLLRLIRCTFSENELKLE
jgi:hypothetical protein